MKQQSYYKLIIIIMLLSNYQQGISKETIKETGNLYLWEYSSGGQKVFILGSIHTAKKDFYPLDKKIEKAFDLCNNLILEINPDSVKAKDLIANVSYLDGSFMKDHIDEELYNIFIEKAEKFGLNEQNFVYTKPWYSILTLTMKILENGGYNTSLGIENYFIEKAREKDMVLHQLETPLAQIKYLSLLDNAGDLYLKYSLEGLDYTVESTDTLCLAWKAGDDELLTKYITGLYDEYPELENINDKIIYERNIDMTDKIADYITTGQNYFIIVGTGHLIGDRSIISKLKEKGFIFSRITKII